LCLRSKLCTCAMVKLVCKNRKTIEEIYTNIAVSNMHGKYMFVFHDNHNDEMCDVMLVKSSGKGTSFNNLDIGGGPLSSSTSSGCLLGVGE
ncbi:unnamed protein product, partial [Brassica rapa subsp. trilocularis]